MKIEFEDISKFWFSNVLHYHKTKTWVVLFTSMVFVAIYVAILVYLDQGVFNLHFKPDPFIFSLLGLVLGLLLVFRTNTAYERWWEGRKILGGMVNNLRNLALKLNAYLPDNDLESRVFLANLIGCFPIAMKEHLRQGVKYDELGDLNDKIINDLRMHRHVPNRIASMVIAKVNSLYIQGIISREQMIIIDIHLQNFADTVGACERIKNTPIPFSYSIHLKKFIFFYILMLPFAIVDNLLYWSVPVMVIVFYAFTGLEVIGEEIEDPFGTDQNDLPTDSIAQKIRHNVHEILLSYSNASFSA
ncbi:MAG: bestrophin family ion channel [Cytophagales bacterium]|nr:bestrophin family ion channel [Cytophagales bacterium]